MSNSTTNQLIVYTDPGSVDPDDWLALLLLFAEAKADPALGITVVTTHHFAQRRAEMVAAMVPDELCSRIRIAVAAEPTNRQEFTEQNSHFPKHIFGTPFAEKPEDRQWFPAFGASIQPLSGTDFPTATDALCEVLSECSVSRPAWIAVLGPPRDLLALPDDLLGRARIFFMGGGQLNGTAGYNWGVSPEATLELLAKLERVHCKAVLVSSGLVRQEQVVFPVDLYQEWEAAAKSSRQRALMAEWRASNRGNALAEHKNLCDPLTLFLAIAALRGRDVGMAVNQGQLVVENPSASLGNYLEMQMRFEEGTSGPLLNVAGLGPTVQPAMLEMLSRGFALLR